MKEPATLQLEPSHHLALVQVAAGLGHVTEREASPSLQGLLTMGLVRRNTITNGWEVTRLGDKVLKAEGRRRLGSFPPDRITLATQVAASDPRLAAALLQAPHYLKQEQEREQQERELKDQAQELSRKLMQRFEDLVQALEQNQRTRKTMARLLGLTDEATWQDLIDAIMGLLAERIASKMVAETGKKAGEQ